MVRAKKGFWAEVIQCDSAARRPVGSLSVIGWLPRPAVGTSSPLRGCLRSEPGTSRIFWAPPGAPLRLTPVKNPASAK